ncbi:MAG: DUF1294 domain-containing protein [Rubripirellula sp.]
MLPSLIIWVLFTSLITAALYGWDKRSAVQGRPRIRERTLLTWSVLGGWPGGWIAGRMFRHKTKKMSYRIQFGVCVILNIAVLFALVWLVG